MPAPKHSKRRKASQHGTRERHHAAVAQDAHVEHFVSPGVFATYSQIDSATLCTIDGHSTEIIRVGDIVVTLPTLPALQADDDHVSVCSVASLVGRVTPAPASQAMPEQGVVEDLFDSEVEEAVLVYHHPAMRGCKVTCQVQELWHARVTSLREYEGQRVAELTWFYRVGDLAGLCSDRKVRAYTKTLASAELVYSDHFTINAVECIFGKSPMVQFTLGAIDLRPLGRNDTFTRGDRITIANGTQVQMEEICWDSGCKLGRMYTPGSDAIRFCDNPNCQRWFHVV
ncbi:hypothetical protein C8Q77DRAFT_1036598, partial [Trametes polyzona]